MIGPGATGGVGARSDNVIDALELISRKGCLSIITHEPDGMMVSVRFLGEYKNTRSAADYIGRYIWEFMPGDRGRDAMLLWRAGVSAGKRFMFHYDINGHHIHRFASPMQGCRLWISVGHRKKKQARSACRRRF